MRPLDFARGRYTLAALAYVLITAGIFRNLLPVMATRIYSDIGDPLLNTSILFWNATHVPLSSAWWNYPSFAPLSGMTAWTEHLLGAYPLTTPIVWATGNPVLAYNVLLLVCFPLNALAMFALARHVTGSDTGAFIAGLAFAFAPYRSGQVSHVQMLMAFGMPLALLGLHQYVERGRRQGVAWFTIGWLGVALSNAYMLVFFPILVALWCLWSVRRETVVRLGPIAVVAMVVMITVAPLLWGYYIRQAAYGLHRDYFDVTTFSADLAGLAAISHRESMWRGILRNDLGEASIFPGLAIVVLSVVAVVSHVRLGATRGRGSRYLVAAAICCFGIALMPMAFARWPSAVQLAVFRPFRVFTVGVIFLVLAVLLSRRFRDAWRRRDAIVLYATVAVVMWLLAVGPQPSWSGSRVLTYGPFWLLMHLPGGDSIRVAARAWLPAVLGLAVTAGAGAAALMRHTWWRWVAVALAVMIVGEGWFHDEVQRVPVSIWSEAIPRNALVMDLPVGQSSDNVGAEYLAVIGGYRTVNGYSGYEPPHFGALHDALVEHRRVAFDAFRRLDDLYVIVRPVVEASFVRWLASQEGAELLFDTPDWKLYRLPKLGAATVAVPLPLPSRGAAAFEIR